ncbi:MAG: post-COAP-1 domain-containing protein [Gemmatimonadaceae bacterium]
MLANTAVSCSGGSITGNVGTFQAPGDLPPGVVTLTTGCLINGTVHVGDAAAKAAFNSFLDTYAALAPKTGDVCPLITGTLADQVLTPGVYCVSSETKTGTLTLNGPPNGTWVIKVPSGALTGTSFTVVMAGGAQACNVTWWVDAAATMTTSAFQGNILAGAAITMTASTFNGNAWAKADVTFTEGTVVTGCAGGSTLPCSVSGDRVTGGGWIIGKSGGKANFAVSGGTDIKKSAFRGHLEYDDKGGKRKSDDFEAKGTGVTAYTALDLVTRRIAGTAKVNGKAGFTYRVDVTDNGEPGRNDVFAISVWNAAGTLVYSASGKLGGGNIQLHKAHARACHKGDKDDDHDHGDHHGNNGHHGDDGDQGDHGGTP